MQKGLLGLLVFALCFILTACPAAVTKLGKLAVTIEGLPTGVDADVVVLGPADFDEILTESQTLEDLEAGNYTITANEVSSGGDTFTATVSDSPAAVKANETTTVTVSYEAVAPGSLDITISGLPAGTAAAVTVTGPNGFSETVTESTTLADLEPGSYTLSAANAFSDAAIVSEAFRPIVTGSPVTVTADNTANASVGYSLIEGSGQLWLPSVTTTILSSYTAAQLASSGSPAPTVSFTASTAQTHEAIAFDGEGNLWVALSGIPDSFIKKYASADLASSGSPSPSVTISGGSLDSPVGLAFDTIGNLWVTNFFTNTLLKYSPDQLLADGSPTPAVTISTNAAGSLDGPNGTAFDAEGNLWISNRNANTLVQYSPDQLTTTGTPEPAATISTDVANSLDGPTGLAFDADENLWVANFNSSTLVRYTSDQLAVTGTPTPAIVISASTSSLDTPVGLALDNSGSLWVTNATPGSTSTLVGYSTAQLASSGSPTPAVIIDGLPKLDVGQLAFSPAPTGLPLNAP
jgi:streptogramin lyase